jgi:uncharacterized membrane protein YjdF
MLPATETDTAGSIVLGGRRGKLAVGPFRSIAWIATAILCAISSAAVATKLEGPPNYRFSFAFLVPLLWAAYFARRALDLQPLHFALFAGLLVLHDLGAFGCYTHHYAGLEFDYYVHFFGGLVGGAFVAQWGARRFALRGWRLAVAAVLLVTGVGGIHEIVEGASTRVLGPKNGMLKIDGDPYDTQDDLLNNLLGALAGVAIQTLLTRNRRRQS